MAMDQKPEWIASFYVTERHRIGGFETEEEAQEALDDAMNEHGSEYIENAMVCCVVPAPKAEVPNAEVE